MSVKRVTVDILPRSRAIRWLAGSGAAVQPDLQARLLGAFIVPLSSAAMGLCTGVGLKVVAVARHTEAVFLWLIGAECLIFLLRVGLDYATARAEARGRAIPLDAYCALGLAWSTNIGLSAALCFATDDPVLQVLAPAIVMGIVSGVVMRDNGAPRYLVALILLCSMPLMVAALVDNEPWFRILLVLVPVFVLSTILKVFELHQLYLAALLAERASERRATHDALTGLYNRAGLMTALGRILQRCGSERFALLYLDLDGFKAINDRYGHAAGDQLLQAAATRIGAAVPSACVAARLGGDEFVVLAPDCGAAEAESLGAAVIAAVAQPYDLAGGAARVGVSIGIACAEAGFSAEDVLARADAALYRAKAGGKGRWAHAPARSEAA